MGAACGCSKPTDNIKDVVALTSLTATVLQPGEGDLAAYQRDNAGCMHNKVKALYTAALTQQPQGLSDIKLSACKAKNKDWTHISHLFACSVHIQRLALWKVTISAGSFALLSLHLATMTQLESLTLSDMDLASFQMEQLADGLKAMGELRELVLSVNSLRAEQFQELAPALLSLKNLQVVALDENEVGNKGAQLIAELLEELRRVRDISLKFNSISHAGLKALLPWVRRRPGLVVHLDGNDLNDEEYDELEQAHIEAAA